jgi:cytochrome oxidase Cu insertion factor (SCO1/SenC/PrrC family)
MRKRIVLSLCALALLCLAMPAPAQQQPQPAVAKTHLKVGDMAPDFKLKDNNGKMVKLSSFRGKKNVVLAFYVLAFTGG